MTTTLTSPHERELQLIQEMWLITLLEGECLALAKALHRGLGWPIVGLMRDDSIVHAAVKRPDGAFHDARGVVERDDLGQPFGVSPPLDIRPFREDELCVNSRKHERMIQTAEGIAALLWPDLPWKTDSLPGRMITFTDELEELSRKHGLWIRSMTSTHPIILDSAVGSEKGYTLEPLVIGSGYTINRRLG